MVKNYIYFNWQRDKRLLIKLFIWYFFTLITALVAVYIMPLSFLEKDIYDVSIIEAISRILKDHYHIVAGFILLSAICAIKMVNDFFEKINKFGYNSEWREDYTAEKIKSAKKSNIGVIIIFVCIFIFSNFSDIYQ